MQWYRADLHVHSVLSPCGDLEMSPARIIYEAKKNKLDIIGISDHNSTLHAELMIELGNKQGITVFPGVEIASQEEVHCLAFFENIEATKQFQIFLNKHSAGFKNNVIRFGHQLVVNEQEEIQGEVDELLIVGLTAGIDEIEKEVHLLNGIFIPAHVDRSVTSIYSQIGFIPEGLKIDAIEFSSNCTKDEILARRPELATYCLITNSDAHNPYQLGKAITEYYMENPTFTEWKMALNSENGRKARTR
jgi:3',5'-nucleoside bisphosphate phosphatase